jgi:hypothetical protein
MSLCYYFNRTFFTCQRPLFRGYFVTVLSVVHDVFVIWIGFYEILRVQNNLS